MSFLRELQERNVVKVAVIYVVTGWLLIQVATAIFPHFDIPDWAVRLVVLLIALGFPVALIMAWALELTPEGIKRAESTVGEKRMWTITILLALATLAWFEFGQDVRPDREVMDVQPAVTGEKADDVSIAVLPFLDLSQDRDQEYFALGMSEELLNVLAKIDKLAVASRTSAFAYQGSKLSAQQIGQALAVSFVLEGSIRTSGDRLRITAQLIDTETDRHLWSETYDRSTSDIFKVQDDIANAIVAALRSALGIELQREDIALEKITDNMSAYELYLEGRAAFNQRELATAIAALERVVELDPDFARGWAQLAAAYVATPGWVPMDRPYIELAREAAEKALAMDDSIALAQLARGAASLGTFDGGFDIAGALPYYQRALELEPRDPTVLLWNSVLLIAAGYFERASELLDRCIANDPAYFNCWRFRAHLKVAQGDVREGVARHSAMMDRSFWAERMASWGVAYLLDGNKAAASLVIFPNLHANGIYAPRLLELLENPSGYPRDRENVVQQLLVLQKAGHFETNTANTLLVALGYPELVRMRDNDDPWMWLNYPVYRESGHLYQHLNSYGVLDLWDIQGPPPFCEKTDKSGIERYRCDLSPWEQQ